MGTRRKTLPSRGNWHVAEGRGGYTLPRANSLTAMSYVVLALALAVVLALVVVVVVVAVVVAIVVVQ